LEVVLELINGLFSDLVKFVLLFVDWSGSFRDEVLVGLFGSLLYFHFDSFFFFFHFLFHYFFFVFAFLLLQEVLFVFPNQLLSRLFFFLLDEIKKPIILLINRHIIILRILLLLLIPLILQNLILHLNKPYPSFPLQPVLLLLFPHLALLTKESLLRNTLKWRTETVNVEPFVTIIANDQLYIVVIIVFVTNFAGHILKSLVPLFCSYICGSQPQVTLASPGATKALSQRSTIHIKLIIEGKLLILLNVPKCKYSNTNFSQNVPFLRNAVRFARMVDKPCNVSLVSRINDFSLRGFHQISAG